MKRLPEKRDTLDPYMSRIRKEAVAEDIFLDRMNGYQFQKFVADVFQRLGYTNVVIGPAGADEGVDIKMEQTTDIGKIRYIVECKHHTEGTIGRPTVQKLHSAIITKAMNKGIIVTSGNFSSDAIEYAENVGIELINIDKLKELANKVRLSIYEESKLSVDNCFPISDEESIVDSLNDLLKSDLVGFHENMANIGDINLRLRSAYMVDFSINARFSTSAGLIHSINTRSSVFFDGKNGRLMNRIVTDPFIAVSHELSEIREKEIKTRLVEKEGFAKSFKDIKENATKELTNLFTKTVS